MYPAGFHPVRDKYLPNLEAYAPVIPRLAVWPSVKYYFVDFGISVHIPDDMAPKRVIGIDGLDQEVPELSLTKPYDPFKVDIFIIGNVFRKEVYLVRPVQLASCLP